MVAKKVSKKQLRTTDKDGPPVWGFARVASNMSQKKNYCITKRSQLPRTWPNVWVKQSNEKGDIRFGNWNARRCM